MARITVEDCLQKVNNRFTLIHMAAKRVRQLRKGAEPTVQSKNKDIVVSLREIAAGSIVISQSLEEFPKLEAKANSLLNEPPETLETEPPIEIQKEEIMEGQ